MWAMKTMEDYDEKTKITNISNTFTDYDSIPWNDDLLSEGILYYPQFYRASVSLLNCGLNSLVYLYLAQNNIPTLLY